MFDSLRTKGFEVLALHHAEAILAHDLPDAAKELESVMNKVELPVEELVRGGGGEGQLTQRIRNALAVECGWARHNFEINKTIDGIEKESISHEIDHVMSFANGTFALEIEWNNKVPFVDRDPENFKGLHADGTISIGGLVTRGTSLHVSLTDVLKGIALTREIRSLQDLEACDNAPTVRPRRLVEEAVSRFGSAEGWARVFVKDTFGEATTHWRKLEGRVQRGVGNPCPSLLIGLPRQIVIF